jgi:hypothetical protein
LGDVPGVVFANAVVTRHFRKEKVRVFRGHFVHSVMKLAGFRFTKARRNHEVHEALLERATFVSSVCTSCPS